MSDDVSRWIDDLSAVMLAETIEALDDADEPIMIEEYRRLITSSEEMRDFLEALIAVSNAVGLAQGYELGTKASP